MLKDLCDWIIVFSLNCVCDERCQSLSIQVTVFFWRGGSGAALTKTKNMMQPCVYYVRLETACIETWQWYVTTNTLLKAMLIHLGSGLLQFCCVKSFGGWIYSGWQSHIRFFSFFFFFFLGFSCNFNTHPWLKWSRAPPITAPYHALKQYEQSFKQQLKHEHKQCSQIILVQ